MDRERFFEPYVRAVIVAGATACLVSLYNLPVSRLDSRFAILAVVTMTIASSRIVIKIPRISSQISVSDTFIFLTILLYGTEAACLLAAVEAFCASFNYCKKWMTVFFNVAVLAVSTFLSASALRLTFGSVEEFHTSGFSANLIAIIGIMAIVQYISNSGLVAVAGALKDGRSVFQTWSSHYLWTSLTYLAGASAAGIVAVLTGSAGLYAFLVAVPIITIVYFTYQTYLKNIEASVAQAAQAERHVAELSHYIAEQERIREQFSQIEKLSALGELASGVAHDFNNTLAGILGRAQLLLRTDDTEKIRAGLKIIIKAAEDGAQTVKRIQDFARQRRDHDFEPVAVDQLLHDVSEITRPRWKDRSEANNIQIKLELQLKTDALVMGDDSELREVLVNMVFNAVDAMPHGGTLVLSTNENAGKVEICISDDGIGMSQEVRSRIFDPFFTTKGKAGLGLGLAVSYGIIRRHEGEVEVESEPGRGTTFRIKLPLAKIQSKVQPIEEEEAAPMRPASHMGPNRTRILVVDDEDSVRELLSDILEGEGYEVATASGGREALGLFARARFDAVFTDIGMPGMSGWELAHAIRKVNKFVPLAVVTGWGEAVGSNEQKAAQVDWVVTKPFRADRITELAHNISHKRKENIKKLGLNALAV